VQYGRAMDIDQWWARLSPDFRDRVRAAIADQGSVSDEVAGAIRLAGGEDDDTYLADDPEQRRHVLSAEDVAWIREHGDDRAADRPAGA